MRGVYGNFDRLGSAYFRRRGTHTDNFIRGRRTVRHHITLLGAKSTGDILFRFQMRPGVTASQFSHRNPDTYDALGVPPESHKTDSGGLF